MGRLMEALRSAFGRPSPAQPPEYRRVLEDLAVKDARLRAMDAQVDAQVKSSEILHPRRRATDRP